jgi:NADH:ubiquinone oxidoreductase subunit 5 (subunit L)/multisubunit Na+/H+ antiporter MnhA subunit
MPVTYTTFLISTLAIAGIPPLAGFFSKDEILWRVASWQTHYGIAPALVYTVLLLTAGMTAFYMGRVTFKTFLGKPRWTEKFLHASHGHGHGADHGHSAGQVDPHGADALHAAPETPAAHPDGAHSGKHGTNTPHESPPAMTIPLVVLGAFAICIGFLLFTPAWFGNRTTFKDWLAPSAGVLGVHAAAGHATHEAHAGVDQTGEHAGHADAFVSLGSPEASEIGYAVLSVVLAGTPAVHDADWGDREVEGAQPGAVQLQSE